jgi:hypothetical protein
MSKKQPNWDVEFINIADETKLRTFPAENNKTYVESKNGAMFYLKVSFHDKTRYRHAIWLYIDGVDAGWCYNTGKGPTYRIIHGVSSPDHNGRKKPFMFAPINLVETGIDFSNQTSEKGQTLGTLKVLVNKRIKRGKISRLKRTIEKKQLKYDKLTSEKWQKLSNPATEINPETVKEDQIPKKLLMNRMTIDFKQTPMIWNGSKYVKVSDKKDDDDDTTTSSANNKNSSNKNSSNKNDSNSNRSNKNNRSGKWVYDIPDWKYKYLCKKTFVFVSTAFLITEGFLPKPVPTVAISFAGNDYQTFPLPPRSTAQDLVYTAMKHWKLFGHYELQIVEEEEDEKQRIAMDTRMRRWHMKQGAKTLVLHPVTSDAAASDIVIREPPKKRQKLLCVDLTVD